MYTSLEHSLLVRRQALMVRIDGIEPTSSVWKTDILTVRLNSYMDPLRRTARRFPPYKRGTSLTMLQGNMVAPEGIEPSSRRSKRHILSIILRSFVVAELGVEPSSTPYESVEATVPLPRNTWYPMKESHPRCLYVTQLFYCLTNRIYWSA